MPSWKVHRRMAKSFGIDLDEETMRRVDRMLDFPRLNGSRLPHKALHNMDGVLKVWRELGEEASNYAYLHILLDRSKLRRLIEELEV
ncbi:MAG: hypothetical protein QXT26_02420 [Thermoproteota archaeon]